MTDGAPLPELVFPPLMSGHPLGADGDPFAEACAVASAGCDAGEVLYAIDSRQVRAALVLAPDVPLEEAVAMHPLACVALQNALGTLAPPEIGVHFGWDGTLWVNGARCGRVRIGARDSGAGAPDWMVIGIEVDFRADEDAPGQTPDRTALYEEGCGDVVPGPLIESWARHSLNWIHRWEDEGPRVLHDEWVGLARGIGEPAAWRGQTGVFVGVDERFGMLLRMDDTTILVPLTELLEDLP